MWSVKKTGGLILLGKKRRSIVGENEKKELL